MTRANNSSVRHNQLTRIDKIIDEVKEEWDKLSDKDKRAIIGTIEDIKELNNTKEVE